MLMNGRNLAVFESDILHRIMDVLNNQHKGIAESNHRATCILSSAVNNLNSSTIDSKKGKRQGQLYLPKRRCTDGSRTDRVSKISLPLQFEYSQADPTINQKTSKRQNERT